MNSKIKYILLDLGGVLVPETMLIINKQISELLGINFEELKKANLDIYSLVPIGKMTLLEFYTKTLERLNLKKPSPQELLSKHIDVYEKNFKIFKEVLEIIRGLMNLKKYEVVSFTNTEKEIVEFNKAKNRVFNLFDKNYISCEIGLMKPDLKAYEFVLRDLDAQPSEVIFIDDKIENLKPAKQLGMDTILYKNPTQLKRDLDTLLNR